MAYVLIADDDELIAEMACDMLIDAGHACGWVTSGEDVWELLARRRPDIVLLDQDMPGTSGIELLRKLRGSERYYDMPVIMFTAITGEEDENRAIYAGAQDYIRKPISKFELIQKIDRVLAKRGVRNHLDLKTRLARDAGFLEETIAPSLQRRWI